VVRNLDPYKHVVNTYVNKLIGRGEHILCVSEVPVEAKIPLKLFLNDKQTLVLKLRL